MRASILGILGGALLTVGCGGDDLGEGLGACTTPTLSDMSLAMDVDGIEVRGVCGADNQATVQATYGQSCAETTCRSPVEATDVMRLGWAASGQLDCVYRVVAMKGANVVMQAIDDKQLTELLGQVDTVSEAELIAQVHGVSCLKVGNKDGSIELLSDDMVADCPVQMQQVLYRVGTDGTFNEIDRGDIRKEGACVGRRPAGLRPRRNVDEGSELGDFLARSAEMEAASVVAFQVLTAELSAYGAPEDLLERSRQAAHDEVRHARMMQRLAQRFGSEISPRSVRVSGVRDLETVARENAVEGCVMETWGCLIGLHQARRARPGLRRVYRQIAADEARHAQLSWDIATWAESQLSPEAVERVNTAKEQALSELEERLEHERDNAATPAEQALGLPDRGTRRRLFGHLRQALWT